MTRKRIVALILVALLALSAANALAASKGIAINKSHFPNDNFRTYVKNEFDSNGDGYLSTAERKAVRKIVFDPDDPVYGGKNFANLKGIEYFTNLTELTAIGVHLSKLDLSKNTKLSVLAVDNNDLTKLDLSKNRQLTRLNCPWNMIKKLTLGKNAKLTEFVTEGNRITSINVSGCTKLKKIFQSHVIQESGGSSVLWRLSHPFQVITDTSMTIKDGKKVLYKKGKVTSIKPVNKNVTLKVGQTWSPSVKITPSTAAIRDYTVEIGDASLLDCPYDDGTVKALKKGKTTITIKAVNSQGKTISATINITIK